MSNRTMERKRCAVWRSAALVFAWLMATACAGVSPTTAPAGDSTPGGDTVAAGDLVRVHYTVRHRDGTPVARDLQARGAVSSGTADAVLAGAAASFPGIGEAVVGMHVGERKVVDLPAARAFGVRKSDDVILLPRDQSLPESMTVPAHAFQRRFGGEPTPGREVDILPAIRGTVAEVGAAGVTLRLTVEDGAVVQRSFGTTEIHHDTGGIRIHFDPLMGSEIPMGGRTGHIVAADDAQVTVDFNHPHAGEDYIVDIAVDSVTKATDLAGRTLPWVADPEGTLAANEYRERPVVLLLYADWCPHCQRLFREVLVDPRITDLADRFVWVKVNSDLHQEYKRTYDQTGFPMIVVLGQGGQVVSRIDGFRDALALRAALLAVAGSESHG